MPEAHRCAILVTDSYVGFTVLEFNSGNNEEYEFVSWHKGQLNALEVAMALFNERKNELLKNGGDDEA